MCKIDGRKYTKQNPRTAPLISIIISMLTPKIPINKQKASVATI